MQYCCITAVSLLYPYHKNSLVKSYLHSYLRTFYLRIKFYEGMDTNERTKVCMTFVCMYVEGLYDEGRLRIRYSTKQGTGKTHKTYGIQIRVSLRSRTYILVFRYSSRSRRISATIPFHQPGGRNTEVCSLFPLLWHLKRLLLKASWAQIESLRREPFAY